MDFWNAILGCCELCQKKMYTCSRILKHNFTQQPAEGNSVTSAEHVLQLSKTLLRITELAKHFLLLLDIPLFKNQPSKLHVEGVLSSSSKHKKHFDTILITC